MQRRANGDVHWAALLKTQRAETEAAQCVTPRQYLARAVPQAPSTARRPDPLAAPLDQWDSPQRPASAVVAPGSVSPATAASQEASLVSATGCGETAAADRAAAFSELELEPVRRAAEAYVQHAAAAMGTEFGEKYRTAILSEIAAATAMIAQARTSAATEPTGDAACASNAVLSDAAFAELTAGEDAVDGRERRALQRLPDFLVLDNSLRETTVGAFHEHNIKTKQAIAKAVHGTGLTEVIIGSYGPTENVDDFLPKEWRAWGNSMDSAWGFADLWDCLDRDRLYDGEQDTTAGMDELVNCGFCNAILEVDTCLPTLDYERFDLVAHVCGFVRAAHARLARRAADGKSRVLVNLRDFPAWLGSPAGFRRALNLVSALAALPEGVRPIGLIYEEPSGLYLPETIGMFTRIVRKTMVRCGWAGGRLLAHVHANFGNADAGLLKALANGADGMWGAVCRAGAQLGHASSAVALVNLARLGNASVATQYDIPRIVQAARDVEALATMQPCDALTEVYGTHAFDAVFGSGPMSYDAAMRDVAENICGVPAIVRLTTFSTEDMIAEALTQRFGPAEAAGWDRARCAAMRAKVGRGIVSGLRFNYNSDIGLCQLYELAQPSGQLDALPPAMLRVATADVGAHPLLHELKRRWVSAARSLAGEEPSLHGSLHDGPCLVWPGWDDELPDDEDVPDLPTSLVLDSMSLLVPLARMSFMEQTFAAPLRTTMTWRMCRYRTLWALAQHPASEFVTAEALMYSAHSCVVEGYVNATLRGSTDLTTSRYTK
jgi:hypothetical protein